MPFYTRTDENGIVIWGSYGFEPGELAPNEVECSEDEYEAARQERRAGRPKAKDTSSAKAKNADQPA